MSAYNAMEMAQIKNQIAQYEANRAAVESIINDANEKIERLRPVKKILEDNKVEVNTQRNTAKTVHRTDIVEWQGSTKTEFTSSVDAGLVEGYNLYYSELDSALDAVNDAITRYENEKYEQNGIIGQIQIVINNLENWPDTLGY